MIDKLNVNTPVIANPNSIKMNATRNWLFLPTVGRNGLPAAACQTSCSEESMCQVLRVGAVYRKGDWMGRIGVVHALC